MLDGRCEKRSTLIVESTHDATFWNWGVGHYANMYGVYTLCLFNLYFYYKYQTFKFNT